MSTKTKNTFATSMFDQIRDSLKNEKKQGNSSFKDIMKFEQGKTYLVRLIPNVKTPAMTFFHYYNHGWNSLATGAFSSALCPTTYGEICPIDNARFKIWKTGTEDEQEAAKQIKRKENWLVNAYIISDPSNPENEGKIKMIRYGKQLHQIIDNAINGDDAEEFGASIFDLSDAGCNLRIKVESNSEGKRSWPTYVASRFLSPSAIPDMTPEKINEIHNGIFDLEKLEEHKTTEQLQEMLDVHFFGKVTKVNNEPTKAPSSFIETTADAAAEIDEQIPGMEKNKESTQVDISDNADIDALLADL